ncbi:STAS/SEC14 domain-containing protein [Microbulbifer epialgicus]|uniref:STAS/SEC14 domain-containing protein n=1 Tax=Microbulbifer epialgicus TaxID=393907 RepID=A0ABV4NVY7_9GAMM
MLKIIDIGIPNALALKISGNLSEADVSEALLEAKKLGEQYEKITIYEEIESFDGLEFSAIIEKFKYLFEVGISNICAAAILTDKEWLKKVVNMEDKLFRGIDMKCFSLDQRKDAIHFLREYAPKNG